MNKEDIRKLFHYVRRKKPLIHQITNQVTMNDCANATLAVGASPVMASSPLEAAEMAKLANALVINIGTIQATTFEGMKKAGKTANEIGIPIIFDPVGAGATSYRTNCAVDLLNDLDIDVIRGNASEVNQLIGGAATTKGVDAGAVKMNHADIAEKAAALYGCTVVVSGKEDAVSDGKHTYLIQNGDPMLTRMTGTGCMSTALIGCFSGVDHNFIHAAIAGISIMGIAGEKAAESLKAGEGLGMFRVKLMDYLSLMDGDQWLEGVKMSEARTNRLSTLSRH